MADKQGLKHYLLLWIWELRDLLQAEAAGSYPDRRAGALRFTTTSELAGKRSSIKGSQGLDLK